MMTSFVKKTTKKAHGTLVQRLIEKSHITEANSYNTALNEQLSLRSVRGIDGLGSINHDRESPGPQKKWRPVRTFRGWVNKKMYAVYGESGYFKLFPSQGLPQRAGQGHFVTTGDKANRKQPANLFPTQAP